MNKVIVEDELLDLVDQNDNVIGKLERSKVYEAGLSNFRVINCFIVNDSGQMWIPRRTKHKRLFPCCLDVSVGGHVSSGETYDEAFVRELYEEAGLSIDTISYKELGSMTPHEHGVSAFTHIYLISSNEVPPFNRNDFSEYYWLYPHEVLERITTIDKAKGDLPLFIRHFFVDR